MPPRRIERLALRLLEGADRACNRAYGWRGNPLYHSGAVAVGLLLALIVSGLWLLLFYRVGSPWASVARITSDPWVGWWMRGLHRYAADALVVAVAVHALRMFAQGRSWGPRVLAWASGVALLALVVACGLTGYVMVWDAVGLEVAREGARLLDSLPVLSEPLGRAFTGEEALLGPFFFINLFAHIAIPLGMALLLWLHVARVAHPVLLPRRRVLAGVIGALLGAALLLPVEMQPEANPFLLPQAAEVDVFYAAWLPWVRAVSPGVGLAVLAGALLAPALVPRLTRRRGADVPPPSVVDEEVCTGCTQCALDCPFEAITMIARPPGARTALVARVDPALCVSCGICAGSCAPMVVGPPGRTGREQLATARALAGPAAADDRPVVIACSHGAGRWRAALEREGAVVHPVDCAGSLHTSVVEQLVRAGVPGVLVVSCPPDDCRNRLGPRWLQERVSEGREAELKARVDRRRVRLAHAAGEADAVAALRAFTASLPAREVTRPEPVGAEDCR